MDETELHAWALDEVERVHRFIVDWFSGAVEGTDEVLHEGIARTWPESFCYVMPSSRLLGRQETVDLFMDLHGSNPDFEIWIEDLVIRQVREGGNSLLVTYVERQEGAKLSDVSNKRRSTVLFDRTNPDQPLWLHIHETALPTD